MTTFLDSVRKYPSLPMPLSHRAVRRHNSNQDHYVVVVLVAIVAVFTSRGLTRYPTLNGDEGIYIEQARAVLHGALSPYTYFYDHPFLGWVQLSVFAWVAQRLHLGGSLAVISTRFVMLAIQMLCVPLVYGIARRLNVRRVLAAAAVLIYSLSPLTIYLTRQIFLDNIVMPWLLLSFFLLLNRNRNLWIFAGAAAAFAIAVLSKETALVFAPALVVLLVRQTDQRFRVMATTLASVMFAMIVFAYPLMALLRGELFPGKGHVSLLENGILYQLSARAGSGAVWTAGTSRHDLMANWLHLDSVIILGGLAAALLLVFSRTRRWLAVGLLVAALPILKPSGYLPSMYIVTLLPFAALSMVVVINSAWTVVAKAKQPLILPLALATAILGLVSTTEAYAAGAHQLSTSNAVLPWVQTRAFLARYTTPKQVILTDDALIVDLNSLGRTDPWKQALSYYKYDLDPERKKRLPNGYHDLNFIIETHQMRVDDGAYTKEAIAHSHIVRVFGQGEDNRIDIREINK